MSIDQAFMWIGTMQEKPEQKSSIYVTDRARFSGVIFELVHVLEIYLLKPNYKKKYALVFVCHIIITKSLLINLVVFLAIGLEFTH